MLKEIFQIFDSMVEKKVFPFLWEAEGRDTPSGAQRSPVLRVRGSYVVVQGECQALWTLCLQI